MSITHVMKTLAAATLLLAMGPQAGSDRVAALKQSMQQSQARLRSYEWIETTTIALKGEEKSRKTMRCYYGADGTVQKLPLNTGAAPAPPPQPSGRGGRLKQRVVEKKTDEMKDYMEKAAALVHQYVPPDAARIQKAKDAGTLVLRPEKDGAVAIEIPGYLLPGDKLSLQVDAQNARLLGVSVNSYLDTPDQTVTLSVVTGTLADGTTYTAETTLVAAAKNITVVIRNSGYRPLQ